VQQADPKQATGQQRPQKGTAAFQQGWAAVAAAAVAVALSLRPSQRDVQAVASSYVQD